MATAPVVAVPLSHYGSTQRNTHTPPNAQVCRTREIASTVHMQTTHQQEVPRSPIIPLSRKGISACSGDEAHCAGLSRDLRATRLDFGDVELTTCTPPTTTRRSDLQPGSPASAANIRIRRSNHEATLLHSPARAGHSIRMKQIFAESKRNNVQDEERKLYPQLPNVSRRTLAPSSDVIGHPPTKKGEESRQAESSFFETQCGLGLVPIDMDIAQSDASLHISEAWSHDSSYIITESRERHDFDLEVKVKADQIKEWLSDILNTNDKLEEGSDYLPSGDEQRAPTSIEADLQGDRVFNDPYFNGQCNLSWMDDDVFFSQCGQDLGPPNSASLMAKFSDYTTKVQHNNDEDYSQEKSTACPKMPRRGHFREPTCTATSSNEHPLKDSGIHLSPLSPNVCIERGPSRFHAARNSPQKPEQSTPTRCQIWARSGQPMLKENLG